MSLISGFANQTATLERAGRDADGNPRYDAEGQPTYDPPETIKVREDPATGVKRSATGADVDAESTFLTEAEVSVQDRVNGSAVRRVEEVIGKGGKRLGCEFYV